MRTLFVGDAEDTRTNVKEKYPGRLLDYGKIIPMLAAQGCECVFRLIYKREMRQNNEVPFHQYLRKEGFDLEMHPYGFHTDMVLKIVDLVNSAKLDALVLMTSRPEVASLVKWAKSRGLKVYVLSVGELHQVLDNCADAGFIMSDDMLVPME